MYGLDDHHLAQCSQPIQAYQDHHFLLQQHRGTHNYGGRGSSALMHHEVPPGLPWSLPQLHSVNPIAAHFNSPVHHRDDHHDPFLVPPNSFVLNTRGPAVQFAYDGSSPFTLQAELEKITAQELMDAKALAASKSHSEAERRRRERIKNHLDKLRSLLPSTTKTDKASLLAEVIQHVKELQRQTSLIAETSPIPAEIDELTVDASDEDGKFIIKASVCCEDRSDLLPDLIKTLKALRLRTLKAEITTLGGRVKNVLFITGEEDLPSNIGDDDQHQQYSISCIQEALKAVMEKSGRGESTSGIAKRQRTKYITVVEQQHQQE